jgi:serine/threonine-protein kinase
MFTPGSQFARRFVVERVLGQGGMGIVFAARHLELDELVAIKVMLPEVAANAEAAARFQREARASVRIKSDHIVRVLDVSRLDDGTPYMVMEYLEGENLDEHLRRHGPLNLETAARYLIEACDAIAAAHSIGIVHRDLKPQNLFLAKQGDETNRIKVLDFGISKVSEKLSQCEATLTHTSSLMGSPLYMSPEQMQSAKTVDHRTDIWALGCVLFELLTKGPPFNAATIPELCAAVLTQPSPSARTLRPDLPAVIDTIIGRCLEKTPEARYATVGHFAQDLLAFAPNAAAIVAGISRRRSSMPPPLSAPTPITESMPVRSSVTSVNWGHATRPPSRKRSVLGLWGAIAALVFLATALFLMMSLRHGKVAAGPPVAAATVVDGAVGIRKSDLTTGVSATTVASKPATDAPPQPTADESGHFKQQPEQPSTPDSVLSASTRRTKALPVPHKTNPQNPAQATPSAMHPKSEAPENPAPPADRNRLRIELK